MSAISKLLSFTRGKSKSRRYEQWSTPSLWRNEDGVYIGDNHQAWMYRTLELNPVKWEDNEARLGIAQQLENLLSELGQMSKDPIGGIRAFSNNREVHIESITWQEILTSPEGNPPALSDFQQDAYGVTVPRRALFVGVKLVSTVLGKKDQTGKSLYQSMEELVKRSLAEDIPEVELYRDDIQRLARIFARHNAKLPNNEETAQLESWFNNGMGADVLIEEQSDSLTVADSAPIQLAAIRKFDSPQLRAPQDQWLMDTLSHPGDAPHVISVRAELEPTKTTRERARMSQRKIQANIEEEEKSGDIEKVEDSDSFKLAKDFEDYLSSEKRPMLASVSIVMAREISDESETYMDFLDTAYGIQMSTLDHRQILALDETLPTSNVRVNPFLQDMNVPMLANAGLQAFSALGDDRGCFTGFIDPDGAPLFIDPSASSRQNLPPAFGVFGDPGSGKSSPVDTPVYTIDGRLITMGELRPGDCVLGLDGGPTRVETIHPQGELDTYRVTLADGRYLDTAATHLWNVLDVTDPEGEWENRELGTFMGALRNDAGEIRYHVPVPRPLDFDEAPLPVDPYTIGAAAVAGAEAIQWSRVTSTEDFEVLNRLDEESRIPEMYLAGSIEQREALLQGIMDSSGGVTSEGFLQATSLHPAIAGQLVQLVRSLGGVPEVVEDAAPMIDVVMELPIGVTPFCLVETPQYNEPELWQYTLPVVSVEKLGRDEHVCITVDADDHLYVSGDYVVSHNTFFAQNFATQCVLYGMPVFFINPKAADSLTGLCDYINDSTPASADTISIMKAEEEPGAFDPFRFANDPLYAAEVAGAHILSALDIPQDLLPRELRLSLQQGLKRGAEAGAQCVWDALKFIPNMEHQKELLTLVEQQMDASSLFALGVAKRPRGRLNMMNDHLTLVHFDREIGLPNKSDESQYSIAERIALATVNLVTKAALEILIANKGGVLVLDEAWTFLSQPEALAALNRISREGRSLNIVPVFLTQRIKDVVSQDLEGFMSRVLVLKLNEADEARAAIKICGLEPTQDRLRLLRSAGPKPPKDDQPAVWAQGLFRDLSFRHSWVALGPTPEAAMKAWSTNPDDKIRFEEAKRARLEADQEEAALAAGVVPGGLEELESRIGLDVADITPGPVPTGTPSSPASADEEDEAPKVEPAFAQQKPAWEKAAEPVEDEPIAEEAAVPEASPAPAAEDETPTVAPAFAQQKPAWQKAATPAEEDQTPHPEPAPASQPAWATPVHEDVEPTPNPAPAPAFRTPAAQEETPEPTPEPPAASPFTPQKPSWARHTEQEPEPVAEEPKPAPMSWSKPAS